MPILPWAARDLYLAMRRQQGYESAEAYRATLGRRAAAGLIAYVLPTATQSIVRRRFSIYAEMADMLPDDERKVVHGILLERIESERLRHCLDRFDARENR
jgi:hypothetical protein